MHWRPARHSHLQLLHPLQQLQRADVLRQGDDLCNSGQRGAGAGGRQHVLSRCNKHSAAWRPSYANGGCCTVPQAPPADLCAVGLAAGDLDSLRALAPQARGHALGTLCRAGRELGNNSCVAQRLQWGVLGRLLVHAQPLLRGWRQVGKGGQAYGCEAGEKGALRSTAQRGTGVRIAAGRAGATQPAKPSAPAPLCAAATPGSAPLHGNARAAGAAEHLSSPAPPAVAGACASPRAARPPLQPPSRAPRGAAPPRACCRAGGAPAPPPHWRCCRCAATGATREAVSPGLLVVAGFCPPAQPLCSPQACQPAGSLSAAQRPQHSPTPARAELHSGLFDQPERQFSAGHCTDHAGGHEHVAIHGLVSGSAPRLQ